MTLRGSCVTAVLSMLACFFVATAPASADTDISAIPDAYDFGTLVQDGDYDFVNDYVTLEGTGSDPVTIGTTSITGTDAGEFSFDLVNGNYCQPGKVLNQGDQCFIDLSVNNLHDPGSRSATLVVESDVPGGETDIPLTATISATAENAPVFAAEQVTDGVPSSPIPSGIIGMSSGEISGDGKADIVAQYQLGSAPDNQLGYLKGNSFGGVDSPIAFDLGGGFPGTTAVGDFNGDGDLDALAGGSGEVDVFLNDGSGNLVAGTVVDVDEIGFSLAVGDYNNDGKSDFAVTSNASTQDFAVLLGNGDGTFQAPIYDGIGGDSPWSLVTADFEGDGSSDLGVINYDSGGVVMLKSDGDGTFTELDRIDGCGCEEPWGLASADLNGDGLDDLVTSIRYDNKVATYIAHADGSFDRRQTFRLPMVDGSGTDPISISTGDLNGDGDPDAVTADYSSYSKTVLVGNGDGTFSYGSAEVLSGATSPRATAIASFDGDIRQDIAIGGEADGSMSTFMNGGQPGQVPSPASFNFGHLASGLTSAAQTITLTNEDGLAPLVVTNVAVGGGSSNDFSVSGTAACLAEPILVGDSCPVQVVFNPTGPAGDRDTTLSFVVDSEAGNSEVPLTGDAESDIPEASVSPPSLNFGLVTIPNSLSIGNAVTVTNTGFVPIDTDAVTVTGANASDFSVGDQCTDKVLAPNTTCRMTASFQPKAAGARSATVEIASNRFDGVLSVPVSGTGVANPVRIPDIKVEPSGTTFDSTQVGSQSPSKSFTVTSTGNAPLNIAFVRVEGSNAGDFPSASDGCTNKALAPGETCQFSYKFAPSVSGERSATVRVGNDGFGGLQEIAVSGTGTAVPAPTPKASFRKKPKKKYVIKSPKLKQVKVTFTSSLAGSKFQCRIDSKKFAGCKSPKVYKNFKPGKHTIKVKAIKAGKTSKPVEAKFKVVRKKK